MRRESHRYRGVRRSSRGAGWGHRAVYVASAVAAASLIAGFGLAGYWFGTFSHTYSQATASGFETAPYGVKFLSAGATEAGLIPNLNWTGNNTTGINGPCQQLGSGNTSISLNTTANWLNQSGALNATILGSPNNNTLANSNLTVFCLDAVNNAAVSYLWGQWTNQTSWDNITAAANNTTAPQFNVTLANLTGNYTNPAENGSLVFNGCNPVPLSDNNTSLGALANCPFFAGNNETTYLPHAGFYNSTGQWVNESTNASPDPAYWHPNETGYLPGDTVFYAAIEFQDAQPNITYQVDVEFAGATPIPQVFFVNSGVGGNQTVLFLFDMSLAWTTGLPGSDYGYGNATGPFYSSVIAAIDTFSVTVSQCYIDHAGLMACPDSLGGATVP